MNFIEYIEDEFKGKEIKLSGRRKSIIVKSIDIAYDWEWVGLHIFDIDGKRHTINFDEHFVVIDE